jgi:hypothetical protein
MLQSIAGTYENGIVQLTEIPLNVRSSKVIVTFLDSIDINPTSQFITLGMFSGKTSLLLKILQLLSLKGIRTTLSTGVEMKYIIDAHVN